MKKIISMIALLLVGLNSVHASKTSQTFSKMLSKKGPLTTEQKNAVAKNVGISAETLKP